MSDHDYRDSRLAADIRADLLARQMTATETCNQLTAVPPWWPSRADGTGPAGLFHAEALNGFPAGPRHTGAALDLYSV
jgi:hypothetical protein